MTDEPTLDELFSGRTPLPQHPEEETPALADGAYALGVLDRGAGRAPKPPETNLDVATAYWHGYNNTGQPPGPAQVRVPEDPDQLGHDSPVPVTCPYCGALDQLANVETTRVVTAVRVETGVDNTNVYLTVLSGDRGDKGETTDGEYGYQCLACRRPVSIPADWQVAH